MATDIMNYIIENESQLEAQIMTHLLLCVKTLLFAVVIAIPLAYRCAKKKTYQVSVLRFCQIIRIIPSVAVLLLVFPILGIGENTAMFALLLLAFPAVFMNSLDGFLDVDPLHLENATALGMNDREQFRSVHLPLAIHGILSGIRIASIELISSATLAAKIGAGGLGETLFTALGLQRLDMLMSGALLVMALALGAHLLFLWIGKTLVKG